MMFFFCSVTSLSSLQGPKSEDDVADGAEAEADEADELSGYEPESDVNTMTVLSHFYTSSAV